MRAGLRYVRHAPELRAIFIRTGVFILCASALWALLPFALCPLWWRFGLPHAAMLPFLCLPLALALVRAVFRNSPGVIYNRFLAKAAALHLIFGLLLGVGFAW